MNTILPPDEFILKRLEIDSASVKAIESASKRSRCRAIVNWITKYKPEAETSNLAQIKGCLETLEYLCELENWTLVERIFCLPLVTEGHPELHDQLNYWGYYTELLRICERIFGRGSCKTNLLCLQGIGNAYLNTADYARANEALEKMLLMAKCIGDYRSEAKALSGLGIVSQNLGHYKRAIDFYKQQLEVARKINDLALKGMALGNLGIAYKQ